VQRELGASQKEAGEVCGVILQEASRTAEIAERKALEIRMAMRRLPEQERWVLWLHFFNGMTLREIAEAWHKPIGTVRTIYTRAKESLRKELS